MAQGTNCNNFTMILSFIAQNRIDFKTQKHPGKPGFLLSATQNRVLKFCLELETLQALEGRTVKIERKKIWN